LRSRPEIFRFRYFEEKGHPLQVIADGVPSHLFRDPPFDPLLRVVQLLRIDLVRGAVQEGEAVIYSD
jgi:hypothetical protein